MSRKPQALLVATLLLVLPKEGHSDQFHYNNILMGDRAIGLAGAYGGVADDASGVFYNPAGLAFALSNDVSGSANAFYQREVVYKKAIGQQDFTEQSGGSLPSFFGGMQKLDNIMDGLVAGFGIYLTDADQKDQDDLIENITIPNDPLDIKIYRFHRTVQQRASTSYFTAAAGLRLTPTFSIGFGLNYFMVDELVQEYQDVRQTAIARDANGDVIPNLNRLLTQNIRQQLTAAGIEPVIGFQFAFLGRFALGLTIKQGFLVTESLDFGIETRSQTMLESDADTLTQTGVLQNTNVPLTSQITIDNPEVEKPLGGWPGQARLGLAVFASPRLLYTLDITHHTAVDGAEKIKEFGDKALYSKEAVTNYATGLEYYIMPSLPVRFGVFTNNDARPEIDRTKSAQRDNIDYFGGTLFLSWVQPNSQIAGGFVYQHGDGEAQKLGDTQIQDVEAQAYTFAFSATHNF